MISNIVNAIKEQAEHIKNVKTFKYEGQDLINAQNNNATIQVYVEDNIYIEYLRTNDRVKVQMNIDILDKLSNYDNDSLSLHNNTSKIAVVLLKLLEEYYPYMMSMNDYSLMNVSRWTDDELYGTRLSLWLIVPDIVNVCDIDEYIDMLNKYDEYIDNDIDIKYPQVDINDIDINPVKLKRNDR